MVRRVDDEWYRLHPDGRAERRRERSEERTLDEQKALEATIRFGFDRLHGQGYTPKSIHEMLEHEYYRYRLIEALEDERTLRECYQCDATQESWRNYDALDAQLRLTIRYLLILEERRGDGEAILSPAEMRCLECGQRLRVPSARQLRIRCPACRAQWEGIYFN